MRYVEAINEALHELLEKDDKVFLIGGGVSSPFYAGQSIKGLLKRFGKERIIDTPISENCVAGVAIGAALSGMKPILMFPRMDFMYYAFDQLVNNASLMQQIYDYKINLTIWTCINRGGEQGAQHSQALQGIFTHIPGFKVYMPAVPESAKNLLIKAVKDDSLVLYIDDRWLYQTTDFYVYHDENGVSVSLGDNVTVVSTSYMSEEVRKVYEMKDIEFINVEILKPLNVEPIIESVKKTGKLIVVDAVWPYGGFAAEVLAQVSEKAHGYLTKPPIRITLPDRHAPTSTRLEKQYYPDHNDIINAVKKLG